MCLEVVGLADNQRIRAAPRNGQELAEAGLVWCKVTPAALGIGGDEGVSRRGLRTPIGTLRY